MLRFLCELFIDCPYFAKTWSEYSLAKKHTVWSEKFGYKRYASAPTGASFTNDIRNQTVHAPLSTSIKFQTYIPVVLLHL